MNGKQSSRGKREIDNGMEGLITRSFNSSIFWGRHLEVVRKRRGLVERVQICCENVTLASYSSCELMVPTPGTFQDYGEGRRFRRTRSDNL